MRIVFMLAAMAAVAGPALAQPAATIAVEGGVSHRTNWRFDGCDECPALTREFGGEVAFLATDSLAVLGGVGLTFYDIDFLSDYITGLEVGLKELTVSTGLRYYGPPGRARFFAEVEVGVNRVTGAFELLELRESASVTGFNIAPGAGVDIAVNDRAAVRISGSWGIGRLDGETVRRVGVGAGLAFNVGRR